MRNLIIGLALLAAPTIATAQGQSETDPVSPRSAWKYVQTPRWAPGALYDASTAVREGSAVTTWFRFINVPARTPAYNRKQLAALPKGTQIDALLTLDCDEMRFKQPMIRLVDASGKIISVQHGPNDWKPLTPLSRGVAVRAPICAAVR